MPGCGCPCVCSGGARPGPPGPAGFAMIFPKRPDAPEPILGGG